MRRSGSISCCVGMCCGAVARCASYLNHYSDSAVTAFIARDFITKLFKRAWKFG